MAQILSTYVVLLFALSVGWPQHAAAGQRSTDRRKPIPVPLLPAEQTWSVALASPPSAGGAIDHARVYVPLQGGQLVALNRVSGVIEWSISIDSRWPPLVNGGVVYVAGTSDVQALTATDGSLLWRAPLEADLMASLAIRDGLLLAPTRSNDVLAFRTVDGQRAWMQRLAGEPTEAAIAAGEAGIYVSFGSRLMRLDPADGALLWERDLPGSLGRPALAPGYVFVGSTDNHLYALATETGRLAWRWRAGGDVVGAVSDGRLVYVASLDNLLRALHRASGNQAWQRALSTRPVSPPVAFGGVVVLGGNDPTLATFDATTGNPIGTFAAPADLQGVPLVDAAPKPFEVAIVAITRDGRAIGLQPVGMMFRELAPLPLQTLPGRPLQREPRSTPNAPTPPKAQAIR